MYKIPNTRYFEILSVSPVEARMYFLWSSACFKAQKEKTRKLTEEGEICCGFSLLYRACC